MKGLKGNYMLNQDFTMEISLRDMLKRHATAGIIAAVLMIGVGVLLFVAPVKVSIGAGLLMGIGIGIQGLHMIVRYFTSKSKNIWDLMLGIINALFAGWLVALWVGDSKILLAAVVLNFVAMILAIILIITGFNKLLFASSLKKHGYTKTGMITFSGWMNLLVAFYFMFSPFVATLTFEWISGVYLIVSGIILLIECIAYFFTGK